MIFKNPSYDDINKNLDCREVNVNFLLFGFIPYDAKMTYSY